MPLWLLLWACTEPETFDTADTAAPALATCPEWAAPEATGTVQAAFLDEISGLARSQRHPGHLWVHEDSGAPPWFNAVDEAGGLSATIQLDGASAFDWEEMSTGPVDGQPGLWLADVGDNAAVRATVTLYGVAEPALGEHTEQPRVVTLTYEDGARDAEAVWIDPEDGLLWVWTKRDQPTRLYSAPLEDGAVLTLQTTVAFGADPLEGASPTAADISPSGDLLVVRTYTHAWAWRRAPGTAWSEVVHETPCEVPVAEEPQGEAIALTPEGDVFTVSESQPVLYRSLRLED